MYTVLFSRQAEKEFDSLPAPVRERLYMILKKQLAADPFDSALDTKKLRPPFSEYRLRMGIYRCIFEVDKKSKSIQIYHILHRKDAYK